MILTLSVHPSRIPDLLSWDRIRLDPAIPANTYHDSFGNFCHVITAPAGRLTMSADFLIHDDGTPDTIAPQAQQQVLGDLPVDVLIYLLGSRYCETDRLSNTAWSLFEHVPKGWPLVQAICDYVHNHSDMSMPVQPKRHGTCIASEAACAATLPISRSPFAAA
jgi:hypothetical protein